MNFKFYFKKETNIIILVIIIFINITCYKEPNSENMNYIINTEKFMKLKNIECFTLKHIGNIDKPILSISIHLNNVNSNLSDKYYSDFIISKNDMDSIISFFKKNINLKQKNIDKNEFGTFQLSFYNDKYNIMIINKHEMIKIIKKMLLEFKNNNQLINLLKELKNILTRIDEI